MSKSERDAALSELTSKLFSAMLGEIIMDTAIQSHQEILRSRAVCDICHTRCGQVHVPAPLAASSSTLQVPPPPSRAPSPSSAPSGSGAAGASTPVGGKSDGNVYLECLGCQHQVASNRYAQHLSSCMGFGGARRGFARTATAKTKLNANRTRSESPYVDSVNGNISDDAKPLKGKAKAKVGKQSVADEDEPLGNRKRPGSPQVPSTKKSKRQKPSASPASRGFPGGKGEVDSPSTPTKQQLLAPPGSQTKVPSKLSTPSFVAPSKSRSPSPGSDSSVETPIAAASTPSSSGSSSHSPVLLSAGAMNRGNGKGKKDGGGKVTTSNGGSKHPPSSAPSPILAPPVRRVPDPDYLIDVEGEETGSSSDTDSS